MSVFLPQSPGIGGLDEITDAETLFLQNISGLSYSQGDLLFYNSSNLTNLGIGTANQVLRTNAGGTAPEWYTLTGGGDVSKVGTPVDNQVGVWTGDGTIEGTTGLTYDGSNLQLTGDVGSTVTRITKGWFTDLEVTNAIAGSITGSAATVTGFTPASGSLTLAGADALTLTTTDTTNVTLPTTGTLATTGQQFYIGTTQVAINRASAALTLAGITLTTPNIGTPSAGTLTNCTGLPLTGLVDDTTTALGVGTLELGHASDTTLARSAAGVLAVEGVVIPSISSTNTLTNKRITPRVSTEASSATPTINTDNVDAHSITAIATDITSMTTNLSGTPTNFQKLIIRIKDNGTARAITWGASFEAKGVALPTTTTISKVLTVGFIYDTVTSKWGCVASVEEA